MCKPTFYNRFFARFYDPIMRDFEAKVLQKRRKRIVEGIHGNVLEIGAGTGANFPLYPAGAKVIAIEPSEPMLRIARQKLADTSVKAEITLVQAGIGDPHLEQYIPDGGFDAIVCTLVLCTVPDLEVAVQSIRKWLKPGGTLHVLEHICSDKPIKRAWQNFINPLWRHFAEGCNLNRHTDLLLKSRGFRAKWEEYALRGGVRLYYGVLELS